MIENNKIRCGNPTCSASMVIHYGARFVVQLEAEGWSLQAQDTDPIPLPYCGRCKL